MKYGHIGEFLKEQERLKKENEEECERLRHIERLAARIINHRPSLWKRIRNTLWI